MILLDKYFKRVAVPTLAATAKMPRAADFAGLFTFP
jgi:hypothetical protein